MHALVAGPILPPDTTVGERKKLVAHAAVYYHLDITDRCAVLTHQTFVFSGLLLGLSRALI